jgi:hypothetical protein
MVTALVAGMLLAGAPQEQSLEYKPKNHTPFAYAARLSEILEAKSLKVSEDGATFTWSGKDSKVVVNEAEGIVKIKSSKEFDLPGLMSVIDISVQKCRVTLKMKRVNEADQTVSADVSLLTPVRIGGGFGSSELSTKARRNGDGTFTLAFNITRDFGADATKREGSFVIRLRSGEKVTFGSKEMMPAPPSNSSDRSDLYYKGGVHEPGVSFEATVSDLPPKP